MKQIDTPNTALITGASSGIGYEIARELARRKYNLVLVSNQKEQLEIAGEQFSLFYGVKTRTVFMDLTETDAATKLYDWCKQEKINVDILVNNAGMFFFEEVVNSGIDQVGKMISLHIDIPTKLCALFGKDMKVRRNGHMLNISSLAAYIPYPGIVLYSATKTFLKSFSRSLRTEMLDYNVNVTCVCPGAVSTNLFQLEYSMQKKLMCFGIMMSAEKLARRAVRAMFRRRALIIPGVMNWLFLWLIFMVPHGVVAYIRCHTNVLPREKS